MGGPGRLSAEDSVPEQEALLEALIMSGAALMTRGLRRWPACLEAVAIGWLVALGARSADASDAVVLPAAEFRVRVSLDAAGELLTPAGRDAPPIRQAVEMAATFDFEEISAAEAAVTRRYIDATASLRVDKEKIRTTLAADARQILVARQGTTPVPYLPDGFLSGEECDLLETPFDSILLDDLLAREAVPIDAVWEVPADLTAGLLCIDTVESGVLEARLEDVVDGRARVVISGIIDGAVDGVPTHLTVEGIFEAGVRTDPAAADQPARYAFLERVERVSAVLRERRQASHVAPGFDVEAKLVITRTPLKHSAEAGGNESHAPEADQASGSIQPAVASPPGDDHPQRRRGPGRPGMVWCRDSKGRFDLVHDARWRRVEDGANGLVMRFVDHGALVGQCSITSLPAPQAADSGAGRPSGVDLQRDIRRSLAGQVLRVDDSDEIDRADGVRIVRVASSGTAEQLPFRWIHYAVVSRDGSRTNITFMFEESLQKRFADADRPLIEGLRLPAGEGQSATISSSYEGVPAVREARETGTEGTRPDSTR